MATLKVGDLQMQADGWAAAQSAAAAVPYVRPVLKWAAQRGYAPDELALITPQATVGRRKRILTRDELARAATGAAGFQHASTRPRCGSCCLP